MPLSKENNVSCVYVVVCYGNVEGIYANQQDAAQRQYELISKNRPADILARSIIYPLSNV